jgi:hypothetical protein
MSNITHLGCDPELFFRNDAGKFISSIGLIGGSKDVPLPIGAGCAVQEDNVAVEFNTPACANVQEFIAAIKHNLEYCQHKADQYGLNLSIVPSAVFDDDQLANEAAQTFGCDPDFNAWKDGAQNPRPKADNPNLRSAGGHIHVETDLDPLLVIKAMDVFVGCPMIEFDPDQDRRKLYGGPGAFRKKNYGVEYRTASNAWITTPERIQWVWDQTDKALEFVKNGGDFDEVDEMLVHRVLLEGDLGALEQLKDKFHI